MENFNPRAIFIRIDYIYSALETVLDQLKSQNIRFGQLVGWGLHQKNNNFD